MKQQIKIIIAGFLTKPFFGYIIKAASKKFIQKNNVKLNIDGEQISYSTIASLFFGFYESSEIRYVKKYLRTDLPIIELGTSLGVISTYCRVVNNNKLICVEANPTLIPAIEKNFQLNKIQDYTIINAAIGYSNKMFFERGADNVSGRLSAEFNERSIEVKMISLSAVLNDYNVGDYILICDIEGGEAQILQHDPASLKNCKQIIIETHEGEYNGLQFWPASLKNSILNLGFTLVDEYGPNYVFKKQ
jgi:FkbM family methyltransferase